MWSDWAREEFAGAFLGHQTRTDRLVLMAQRLGERPAGSVTAVFSVPAECKAAYRWLSNDEFTWEEAAQARHEACARRSAAFDWVIAIGDGSSYAVTDLSHTHGTGPIGRRSQSGRGLKTMTLAVLTPRGQMLGIGAQLLWARSEVAAETPAWKRDLKDKESRYWGQLRDDFESTLASTRATTRIWFQFDAEADMVDMLLRARQSRHEMTVRVKANRTLAACSLEGEEHPSTKMREVLQATEVLGYQTVRVHRERATKRRARVARLELRAASVSVHLRWRSSHAFADNVCLNVVWAREVGTCPEGEEPIEWELWTTHSIATEGDVQEVLRAYALRWRVERLFYATKSGVCGTEQTQLRSFGALAKWVVLQTSVAARLLRVMDRSRLEPEVPASEEFEADEIEATQRLYREENRRQAKEWQATPTLSEMVGWLARLGGYTGKSSGGPPGMVVLERGWTRVEGATKLLASLKAEGLLPTSPPVRG